MKDLWNYDPIRRVIYDENGLAVARDVGAADARRIIVGMADSDAAEIVLAGCNRAREEGDDIPDAVDTAEDAAIALQAEAEKRFEAGPPPSEVTPLFVILDDMLRYEAEKFDRTGDGELNVSGADLVDAFAVWRLQLRETLEHVRAASTTAIVGAAQRLAGTVREMQIAQGQSRHLSEPASIQEVFGDVTTAFFDGALARLCAVAGEGDADPIRIGITLEGGLVQSLWSDQPVVGVEITVFDFDAEGADRDAISIINVNEGDEAGQNCIVSTFNSDDIAVSAWPTIRDYDPNVDE